MRLTLLCGPANSGKVATILDRVVAACADGRGAWLVVPTQADVARAQRELATRGPMLLGARVGTFRHLAAYAAGMEHVPHVEPAVETLLVARAVGTVPVLRDARHYPNYVQTVRRRLDELRSARAGGEASFAEALAGIAHGERDAWRTLLRVVDEQFAARGVTCEALTQQRGADLAEAGTVAWSGEPVLVYGFDDFTAGQERLLLALARTTDVVVSMPFVPGRAVFERRQQLVDRWRRGGATLVDAGVAGFESPVLRDLEAAFGEPAARPVPGGGESGDVRFVECCGPLQEAEAVVREVARRLAAGIAPGEIAVLGSNVARQRPLLEAVFRRSHIAVSFETARTVRDTPAGRAVLDALASVVEDDPVRYAAFAGSRVSPAGASHRAEFDAYVHPRLARGAGVSGRHWWLERAVDEVRALAGAGADAARVTRELLGALLPRGTGDVRVLAALDSQLDELVSGAGDESPSLAEIAQALAEVPIPAPTEREPGRVVVAPVTRVRTDRFDSVVVYGLHSGGFAPTSDELAPLLARELAYVAFTRARRSVSLVRQAAGSDGRVRAPHVVWRELRRLAPDAPLERRGLDEVVPRVDRLVLESEVVPALALLAGEGWDIADAAAGWDVPVPAPAREEQLDAGALAELGELATLSVSELEEYAGCPARWFAGRKLRANDRDTASARQIVGSLAHGALAALVPERAAGSQPDATAVDRALARAARDLPAGALVSPVDRAVARRAVERLLEDEIHGTSVVTEASFGGDGDQLGAVEVDGVRVRGRIDRMDIGNDGAVVVHDYKLARDATSGAKLLDEGKLQLPMYWAAIAAHQRLRPVAAVYRPLEGSRPRGIVAADEAPHFAGEYANDRVDAARIEELVAGAIDAARAAIAGIRSGGVAASPRGGTCPSWCDLDDICRVERV